jgi:PadR family transcriptional regulator PadR
MTDLKQIRKGSTPLLILGVLQKGPLHGYAIMRELEVLSDGYFNMTAALLYPTLHRMEQDGLIQSKWEESSGARRRKVYKITQKGLNYLVSGEKDWRQFLEKLFTTINRNAIVSGDVNE